MSNYYDGTNACCRTCGYYWQCTRQESDKQRCGRCEKILDEHPELWEWVLGVIRKKLDAHEQTDH